MAAYLLFCRPGGEEAIHTALGAVEIKAGIVNQIRFCDNQFLSCGSLNKQRCISNFFGIPCRQVNMVVQALLRVNQLIYKIFCSTAYVADIGLGISGETELSLFCVNGVSALALAHEAVSYAIVIGAENQVEVLELQHNLVVVVHHLCLLVKDGVLDGGTRLAANLTHFVAGQTIDNAV